MTTSRENLQYGETQTGSASDVSSAMLAQKHREYLNIQNEGPNDMFIEFVPVTNPVTVPATVPATTDSLLIAAGKGYAPTTPPQNAVNVICAAGETAAYKFVEG